MRLITRSDFDGLACGALLKEAGIIDTWEFAHKYCGRIWYFSGLIMLPITVIFLLLVIGENKDCVGTVGGIICGVQLIPFMGSVLPTEIALKKNFDKKGKKKLDE